jgi:uncharacterized OB-fold protein
VSTPEPGQAKRPLPVVTPRSHAFWHGGADGHLHIGQCQQCGFYSHPPLPYCPRCHADGVTAVPVSGVGSVYSFTIERYTWLPDLPAPYVVAEVELVEQDGLRLLTTIVDCNPDDVTIGMRVAVSFIRQSDVFFPVFRPLHRDGQS